MSIENESSKILAIGNELADAADTINEAHADGATPNDIAWDRLEKALNAWNKLVGN